MRIETVQYNDDSPPTVVQLARWAGVGLLFYTAALGLERLGMLDSRNVSTWDFVALLLPYVSIALVLLFSFTREASSPKAPLVLAGVIIVATLALAVRTLTADQSMLAPWFGDGVWSALQVLSNYGLPMALLVMLLTAREGRLGEVMPRLVIAAGVFLAVVSYAVALHDLERIQSPSTWQVLRGITPASSLAFLLIVAGLQRIESPFVRTLTLVCAGLLTAQAVAGAGSLLDSPFTTQYWLVAINLTSRAAMIVLLLSFAGLLPRAWGYLTASVCMVAILVASTAFTMDAVGEASGLFWLWTVSIVQVAWPLLLALVIIEVQAQDASLDVNENPSRA